MVLKIDASSTALLIIDFQQDIFNEGPLRTVGSAEVLPKAKKVLSATRAAGLPIIHTQEVHRKEMVDFGRELDGVEPVHCLETWAGTDFHLELSPRDGEFAIAKRRYSAFFATDLDLLLRGLKINTLVIMGTLTNVCVHYTTVDAHQHDYFVHVIEDCCIGSDWEAHWASLNAIEYLQRESRITHMDYIQTVLELTQVAQLN